MHPVTSSNPSQTLKNLANNNSGTFSEKVPESHSTLAVLANLDFEYEHAHLLANPDQPYKTPPPALRIIERWRHILRLLPGFEDAQTLLPGQTPDPSAPPITHLLPWGVTPTAVAPHLRARTAPTAQFPDSAAVAHVNDKRFSHALEQQTQTSLPHSRIIASLDELEHAAQSTPFDWVAKHPLGVSGRERILGKAHKLDPQLATWATRQFQAGWQLVFEPWLTIEHEYSLQFEITPDGAVHFLGACELLTDSVGTFRGHRSLTPHTNPAQANLPTAHQLTELATPALNALFEAGYFGPVGLDALTGRLGSQPILRPITEINARITFGRLAIELARYVPEGWKYIWWHPSKSAAAAANLEVLGPLTPDASHPGTYLLPHHADPHGRSQSLVLIAPPDAPFPYQL